jgi:hypothetical protein
LKETHTKAFFKGTHTLPSNELALAERHFGRIDASRVGQKIRQQNGN